MGRTQMSSGFMEIRNLQFIRVLDQPVHCCLLPGPSRCRHNLHSLIVSTESGVLQREVPSHLGGMHACMCMKTNSCCSGSCFCLCCSLLNAYLSLVRTFTVSCHMSWSSLGWENMFDRELLTETSLNRRHCLKYWECISALNEPRPSHHTAASVVTQPFPSWICQPHCPWDVIILSSRSK